MAGRVKWNMYVYLYEWRFRARKRGRWQHAKRDRSTLRWRSSFPSEYGEGARKRAPKRTDDVHTRNIFEKKRRRNGRENRCSVPSLLSYQERAHTLGQGLCVAKALGGETLPSRAIRISSETDVQDFRVAQGKCGYL